MFYEVRIFNPNKKLKKVIDGATLSKSYWERFYDDQAKSQSPFQVKEVGKALKKHLDLVYCDDYCGMHD